MSSRRYSVWVLNREFKYFDNRVDNEFDRISNLTESDNQAYFRNNSTQINNVRVKLDGIESGTVLIPKRSYGTIKHILLRDDEANYYYCYFISNVERIMNDWDEYTIELNYFATFGEDFLFKRGRHNALTTLNSIRSNIVPLPVTAPADLDDRRRPNRQYWSWLNESAKNLPAHLNAEVNGYEPFSGTRSIYNIFNATYVTDMPNPNRRWTSIRAAVHRWGGDFNRNYPALGYVRMCYPSEGCGNGYYRDINVLYTPAGGQVDFNVTPWPDNDIQNMNNRAGWDFTEFLKACEQADEWLLLSITDDWWESGHSIYGWYGNGDNKTKSNIVVAIPIANIKRYNHLAYRYRMTGFSKNFLGIFKMKSNNLYDNDVCKAVVPFSWKNLGMGEYGSTAKDFYYGWVLSGPELQFAPVQQPLSPQLGPIQQKVVNLQGLRPVGTLYPAMGVIRTFQDALNVAHLIQGNTVACVNTGATWINYDWTRWTSGDKFTINYAMLGYEMTWIEPNGGDVNNIHATNQIWPWFENKLSLGLGVVRDNNLNRFDTTEMDTIRKNANQWQVGQNQAQYNFDVARQIRRKEGAQYSGVVDMGKGADMEVIGGGFQGFLTGLDWLMNPNKMNIKRLESKQKFHNAWYDTQKLPAMYRDLQASNVGTYPAGNFNWTDGEPISLFIKTWNPQFTASVMNYLHKEGWITMRQGFVGSMLQANYASSIFNIRGDVVQPLYKLCSVKFERDLNQMNQIVNQYQEVVPVRLPLKVKEWLVEWMTGGIRIRYELNAKEAATTYDLKTHQGVYATIETPVYPEIKYESNNPQDNQRQDQTETQAEAQPKANGTTSQKRRRRAPRRSTKANPEC